MYLKATRLTILVFVAAIVSNVLLLSAAHVASPKYITAAILVDLKPKFYTGTLKEKASKWDKAQIEKLGQSFIDRRTLLEPSSYHMTLANFEFDVETLDEAQKKRINKWRKKSATNSC